MKTLFQKVLRSRKSVISVLLIVIAICALKPAKNYLREFRFERSLSEAVDHFGEGNGQQAEHSLKFAWHVSDQSLEELRKVLGLAQNNRSPMIVAVLTAFLDKDDLKREDYDRALGICLDFGQPHLFSSLYEKMPDALQEEAHFQFYQSRFLASTGRESEALSWARSNLQKVPEARSLLRQLLLKNRNEQEAFEEAAALVREDLASVDSEVGLLALRDLQLFKVEQDHGLGNEIADWLERTTVGTVQDLLFAHGLVLSQIPEEDRQAFIVGVRDKFGEENSAEVVRWLLKNHAAEALEEMLSDESAVSEDTYLARIQVAIDRGDYKQAWKWLEVPHPRVEKHLVEALKSGLAYQLGDSSASLFHRNRAIQAAALSQRYKFFSAILMISERFEDRESSEKVAMAMSELNPGLLPSATKLEFLDRYMDFDANAICAFYERLHASRPSEPFTRRKYALMLTVAGEENSRARRLLMPLLRTHPSESLSCAIAMTWLRDDPARALAEIEEIDPSGLQDPAKLIYATILSENGKADEAKELSETLDESRVQPYLLSFLRTF